MFDPVSYVMGKQAGGGGGDITVESLSVTENGTTTAPSGKAYSPVVVSVPNSYTVSDEGKVVSNGALVAQTAMTATQNGTVDTTLNNSVTVNVQAPVIPAPIKDVVFVDYDGEIVQEYTSQEFLALTEMPANPTHTGLTAQGWNWTLADAKTYVQSHGCLCIGQNYTTSDGKTRVHIHITEQVYTRGLTLKFNLNNPTTLVVDWEDGNTETVSGNGNKSVTHTYSAVGDYLLTVNCTSGAYGWGDTTTATMGVSGPAAIAITEINIGSGVTRLYGNAFAYASNCQKISIPTGISDFSSGRDYGYALAGRCFVYPSGTTNIQKTGSPIFISVPKSVTAISSSFGSQTRMITLPEGASITGYGKSLQRAERISIPGLSGAVGGSSNATTWGTSWYCRSFTFGTGVTSIAQLGFNAMRCSEIHLLATTPPTLSSANAFSLTYLKKIYVPYSADHSVLEAYQTATNWSSFTSIIEEEPQ